MGAGMRTKEIRRRRSRRKKRQQQETKDIVAAIRGGRNHEVRVKLAEEFREKSSAGSAG